MTIHREGKATIAITFITLAILNGIIYKFAANCCYVSCIFGVISIGLFLFIVSFFRIPNRKLTIDENKIICPADGKVVVIE